MKRKLSISLILLILLLVFFLFFFIKPFSVKRQPNFTASQVPKWTASTQAVTSLSDFRKALTHYYPSVKKVSITNRTAPVIPGLRGAWSIDGKTKQAAFATKWTPQGLTTIDNRYAVVSAYDGNHRLNSLLYVIDLKSGRYLKSLILPSKAHVGGIEYDASHKLLWVATDAKHSAAISNISLKNLQTYDAKVSHAPISFDANYPLPWLKATSTLAYSKLDRALIIP